MTANAGKPPFLSRLCGGELIQQVTFDVTEFLSRLCGGEPIIKRPCASVTFLSRLCGGERYNRYF